MFYKKVKVCYYLDMIPQNYNGFLQEALLQIKNDFITTNRENEFYMFLNNIEYIKSEDLQIFVSVPSKFIFDSLNSKGYTKLIENKLLELSGQNLKLKITVSQPKQDVSVSEDKKSSFLEKTEKKIEIQKVEKTPHPKLNTRYRFENFIKGENNVFALNASIGVSKNLGKAYNPLFIYGGVGLGKTHLMQAIGNEVYNNSDIKAEKIICITAEDFINDFGDSIKNTTQNKFKNKYRQADLLLIDDIHFLLGKKGTQEELFYTFEELYNHNKQMVFTCDRPASELKDMTDRLRSRISRGLNVDLTTPNYETRLAILKKKNEDENLKIDNDVLDLIAKNVSTNVRDLESSLSKINAYQTLLNQKVTKEIAENILKEIIFAPKNMDAKIDTIQKIVANHYEITVSQLKGKSRSKTHILPRHIAIYLSRELTEYSLTEIGQEFDKDHTTIMNSIKKIDDLRKTDPTLEITLEHLKQEINEYKAK